MTILEDQPFYLVKRALAFRRFDAGTTKLTRLLTNDPTGIPLPAAR